jgi:hypothetical protein
MAAKPNFLHKPELPVHHVTGCAAMARGFGDRIHKIFVGAASESAAIEGCFPMSISSIPASAPVKAPEAAEPQPPQPKPDGDAEKVGAPQPTVLAALPPGQGTRIDQLV